MRVKDLPLLHVYPGYLYAYKGKNLAPNVSSVSTARNIYRIYDPALSLFQLSSVLEAQEISNFKIYTAS